MLTNLLADGLPETRDSYALVLAGQVLKLVVSTFWNIQQARVSHQFSPRSVREGQANGLTCLMQRAHRTC